MMFNKLSQNEPCSFFFKRTQKHTECNKKCQKSEKLTQNRIISYDTNCTTYKFHISLYNAIFNNTKLYDMWLYRITPFDIMSND